MKLCAESVCSRCIGVKCPRKCSDLAKSKGGVGMICPVSVFNFDLRFLKLHLAIRPTGTAGWSSADDGSPDLSRPDVAHLRQCLARGSPAHSKLKSCNSRHESSGAGMRRPTPSVITIRTWLTICSVEMVFAP